MKEHPILFSTPMVQALLREDNPKTQTRRVVKFPKWMQVDTAIEDCGQVWCERELAQERCPYGRIGDRLWVRETFVLESDLEYVGDVKLPIDRPIKTITEDVENGEYHLIPHYRATEPEPNIVSMEQDSFDDRTRWHPSIFMPRWASRITLEITDIKVQRLWDITSKDIEAEGIIPSQEGHKMMMLVDHIGPYAVLWNKINGKKYPWSDNPWVWVISFKRV